MQTFTHVLAPFDFGDPSEHALEVATSLAEKFGAKITLLHSTWMPPAAYAGAPYPIAWPLDDMERNAKQSLEPVLAKLKARVPSAEAVFAMGEPWEQILQTAQSRGADLIVMGTHGRRGVQRFFLGSVAEKVVRLSAVPVLTVSAPRDREAKEKMAAAATASR